jgi:hypothetical protein
VIVYKLNTEIVKKIGLGNLQKWSSALKNNRRKARRSLGNRSGGKCCLRVAEETLIPKEYWSNPYNSYISNHFWPNTKVHFNISVCDNSEENLVIAAKNKKERKERGLKVDIPIPKYVISFDEINDGKMREFFVRVGDKKYKVPANKGLSHKKIAEIVDYVIGIMKNDKTLNNE